MPVMLDVKIPVVPAPRSCSLCGAWKWYPEQTYGSPPWRLARCERCRQTIIAGDRVRPDLFPADREVAVAERREALFWHADHALAYRGDLAHDVIACPHCPDEASL